MQHFNPSDEKEAVMKKSQRKVIYILLSLLPVLLFAACGGGNGKTAVDKNERLSQRLESYISARKHSNLGQLQNFYLKPEQARIGKIIVKECTVVSIKIKDDGLHAETKLVNKISAMGFTFDKVPQTINWIWSNRDWYIELSENAGNPFARKKSVPASKSRAPAKEQGKK